MKNPPLIPSHHTYKPRIGRKRGLPEFDQAEKIVQKMGGAKYLAALLKLSITTVFYWRYAPPVGANGLIPAHNIPAIKRAARRQGVFLTDEDWNPERIDYTLKEETEDDPD